jgi:hypothetical protein
MSTRSNIAILNPDGTVRGCYIHWDGYPDGVGKELLKDFSTPEAINARLDKGDGSSLYDGFYKDRGEDDVDAKTFSNESEYLTKKISGWIEYQYLFKDGEWYCYDCQGEDTKSICLGKVKDVVK